MDFEDTPEEAAFRAEVHAWLADNAKPARSNRADDLGPDASRRVAVGFVVGDLVGINLRSSRKSRGGNRGAGRG